MLAVVLLPKKLPIQHWTKARQQLHLPEGERLLVQQRDGFTASEHPCLPVPLAHLKLHLSLRPFLPGHLRPHANAHAAKGCCRAIRRQARPPLLNSGYGVEVSQHFPSIEPRHNAVADRSRAQGMLAAHLQRTPPHTDHAPARLPERHFLPPRRKLNAVAVTPIPPPQHHPEVISGVFRAAVVVTERLVFGLAGPSGGLPNDKV